MLSIKDINEVSFRKSNFSGYNSDDVDQFIDEVLETVTALTKENAEIKTRKTDDSAAVQQLQAKNAELQEKILEKLGFTPERAQAQFGFLMEALKFGAPPMGGFALGLDRVCMLLAGADNIREGMAFPKTASGSDLMSAAPSEVSGKQLKEVSLRLL